MPNYLSMSIFAIFSWNMCLILSNREANIITQQTYLTFSDFKTACRRPVNCEDLFYLALLKSKFYDGVVRQILLGKLKSQFLLTLIKIRKRFIIIRIWTIQLLNNGEVQI